MKRRLGAAALTGLGSRDKGVLDNKYTDNVVFNERCIKAAKSLIDEVPLFIEMCGCDFKLVDGVSATFGIEATYQHDKTYFVHINKNIDESYVERGYAFGLYGTNVVSSRKTYGDFRRTSATTKLIKKYYAIIFGDN